MERTSIENYKKENEIDLDLAIGLATLDEKALTQLKNFSKDYILYCCGSERISRVSGKEPLSVEEFIRYCRNKLKISKNNEIKDFEERMYYWSLLNFYKSLLSQLMRMDDEVIKKFFVAIDQGTDSFYQLCEYILYNYDKQDLILKNLEKLKEIGISRFIFDECAVLDGDYTIVVLENREMSKQGKKVYGVKGVACDGEKVWFDQVDDDGYDFKSIGSSYVISYIKGTAFLDDVKMIIRSLGFDSKTLPTREELFDLEVLPEVDFELINKKTRVVNLSYSHECSLKVAEELLEHSRNLIFYLEYGGFNEKALEIKKQLIFLEAFIATAKGMSSSLASEYFKSGVVSPSELHELVEKKKRRELSKKVHPVTKKVTN